ncbi:MAG: hypothetical protein M1814_005747 [Vezdaea aestivalis]|nr:MAG: hypothetical protein M1814_005747 [Vezdaea aestivalis]
MASDLNLQAIHDLLIETAHKAGAMILAADPSSAPVSTKNNSADLVTETDQAVEAMIQSALLAAHPSFQFLGEETFKAGMALTITPTFICDPIDGTTNFVHGYPYVSVSLGLAVNRKPTVGVVYNPFTSTLYSAISGHGAFKNRTTRLPIRSPPPPLSGLRGALVAVEWGSDRKGNNYDIKTTTFRKLAAEDGGMVHSLKSLGSAALNMCGVAEGGLDAYWEAGCWAWDVCAGWVVLEEAGGIIVDGNPGSWGVEVDSRRYLAVRAAKETEQKELVKQFWELIDGRFDYVH